MGLNVGNVGNVGFDGFQFFTSMIRMSCSINRFKFQGTPAKPTDTQAAKEMDARLQEMLAVRSAQDGGNFKARYEHPGTSGTPGTPTSDPGGSGKND